MNNGGGLEPLSDASKTPMGREILQNVSPWMRICAWQYGRRRHNQL